ncbi:MAG: polyphosphate kinase 1 [Gemmatimonadetes bacterium]|nr:polyphosphate kinase 1 [Gemmatimonadota bacterium]
MSRNTMPRAVTPQPVRAGVDLDHPSLYFNRELGWLDFNWRVLFQAEDERIPLLERVRFLAITCANLDDFVQKRVGGLKRQEAAGVLALSRDGRPVSDQLRLIRDTTIAMSVSMTQTWERSLRPLLRERAGVVVSSYADLDDQQRSALDTVFREHIYPVLTPLAFDPGHPFPFISNLSLSLAVQMRHPHRGTTHFARLKIPTHAGRWIRVPDSAVPHHFVPVEQVILHNVPELFRGMIVESAHLFRVTRNADVRRDGDEAEDLVELISEELRERRFAPVVRVEVESEMPAAVRDLLARELELGPDDVYEATGLLAISDCSALAELDLPAHRFEPWEPVLPQPFHHEGDPADAPSVFATIKRGDILVHHPYDSFSGSVLRLIEEAADDPDVVSIKQTLYRTSENSPVVRALARAAEHGKQVAVLVEVKARFDEARNIGWAQALEDAGVHVTYGVMGLKTHAKVVLVVRYEAGRPVTYFHVGTGNYHAATARLYSDVGLLSCNPTLGADLVNFFHFVTGYAPDQQYQRLIVAPRDMRGAFEDLIRREVRQHQASGGGRIIAKMNALDDTAIIRELYRASQAGVKIDLIVRGHTRLRPGVPGYSENIRLVSIVGRFLEHERIYWFHNQGEPQVYIGSADWRERNLRDRIEAIVPVDGPEPKRRLAEILEWALEDNRLAWELDSDGQYVQRVPTPGGTELNLHRRLMSAASERTASGERPWKLREV